MRKFQLNPPLQVCVAVKVGLCRCKSTCVGVGVVLRVIYGFSYALTYAFQGWTLLFYVVFQENILHTYVYMYTFSCIHK